MADSATSLQDQGAAAPAVSYPGGVSVIVCTYNRRPLLEKLADSLRPQLVVDYPLEIIVVDNNSGDGTAAYAQALAAENPAFVYLFEPRQGLSHARNAGAAAARHEFLLYLDDDVLLPPHYLPTLGRRLARHDPDFFGGPLYPLYVDPKPDWFPESLEVRKKAARSGFDDNIVLTGANYGVKREVLKRVGGFDPAYGMTGGKVGMLEERLVIETYRRLVPPEEQKVYYGLDHFILNDTPARRMTLGFQLKRIFIGNAGFIRWSLEQGVRSPGLLLERVWRAFWGEMAVAARQAPSLWRERRKEPERPMLALVKLTYRAADLWGALGFFASDFGRVARRRKARGAEARPLRAALFTAGGSAPARKGRPAPDAAEIGALAKAMAGLMTLEVVSVGDVSDDRIREIAGAMNLRALDLLITDSPKAARALAVLRGPRPHLQILLWIRDPKPFNYLKTPRHLWDKRQGLLQRLSRDRALVREMDQVVLNAAWLDGPLARLLLPMPRRTVIPALAPNPEAPSDSAIRCWSTVIEDARLWSPRRLAP